MSENRIALQYFSDLLCIWAYVGDIRLDRLRRTFETRIEVEEHYVPVFGNTAVKIGEGWADRGGFEGYARHVREVADGFAHMEVHPDTWTRVIPAGSWSAHQFVKAASNVCDGDRDRPDGGGRLPSEDLAWELRLAFFRGARDIARLDVQTEIAEALGLPVDEILARLADGRALAALAQDHELASRHEIKGSPTYLMNEGRQKLYGNVGYRVIEANVEELLRDNTDRASWC